jgi:mannose-1-phosphate guanylyltransferase
VLEPSVLQRIELGRKVSIEREIFPLIVEDGRLFAMATDDYWIDTGRPEPYRRANLDMIDGVRRQMSSPGVENGAKVHATALIEHSLVSSGAVIAPGASIHDSVILATAVIQEGALVRDSIVMGTVGERAMIIDTVVGVAGVIADGATLEHAFVPDPSAV